MRDEAELFLAVLSDSSRLLSVEPDGWNPLMRMARHAGLVARLEANSSRCQILERLPRPVREQFDAYSLLAAAHQRTIRWEFDRLSRALSGIDVTPILLKGAAYVMAGLPTAGGRLVRDVDLLVPRDRLAEVEQALRVDGWESLAHDRYDDHYYRTWMHELPPLRHKDRGTVVDVHHAILPLTGRIHPDPELLWAASRPILDGTFRVLGPEDMVLHSAAHLFRDGELCGGLRDLTDLDSLLRHFGDCEGDFWKRLVPRAEALQLSRPLYYALRFTGKLLRTPVPDEVRSQSERHAPNWVVRRWMDCLAIRALLPESRDGESFGHATARMVMYVRSHWLRMPPWLLARHLTYKAMRSRAKRA